RQAAPWPATCSRPSPATSRLRSTPRTPRAGPARSSRASSPRRPGVDRRVIAAFVLVLVACAAPWSFGAVEPYWWGLAAAACLVVGGAALFAAGVRGDAASDVPLRARRLSFALPLVALVGLVPVAPAMRRLIAGTTAATLEAADPDAATSWRPIS